MKIGFFEEENTGNKAMLRAAREALIYSRFRDVFGMKIYQFPMAARQVNNHF